ncbi:MAG: glycosyltransferase [Chloroflexota bacterium]
MIGPFGFHPNKTMYSRALPLAKSLVARGHEVRLFMPPWHTPQEADRRWDEKGVSIRYVSLSGGTIGITQRLVSEATGWQPDVVHSFKPKAYSGLAAWWLWQTRRNQIRLIMDSDDWEGAGGWNDKNPYSPIQKRFFAWQEQWGMTHCHHLTVASRALETIGLSMGIPQNQLLYCPNGAGFDGVHPVASDAWYQARASVREKLRVGQRPLLLLYSRLFEFDTQRLVAILQQVKTAVPDLKILSIGSGLFADEADALRRQFTTANLLDSVIDAGWLEPADLVDYLAAADVGIYLMEDSLLNRTKCPVKLADMIRAGLPVVGEMVGQVSEYIDNGSNGYLYPTGQTEAISSGICRLLQDETLRHQQAAAAQKQADRFDWAKRAAELEAVYQGKPA